MTGTLSHHKNNCKFVNQNGTQIKNNMYLYTKADASSIKMNVVRKIIKDIGLDLEKLQTEGKLKLPQKE